MTMPTTPLRPAADLLFKKWLTEPGHRHITQAFIKDHFGYDLPTSRIHIAEPYHIGIAHSIVAGHHGRKPTKKQRQLLQTLRDVTIDIDVADLISEIQVRREDVFVARCLYYLFSRYTAHYPGARRYEALRPVHALNLTGFSLFPDEPKPIQRFCLRDRLRPDGLVLEDVSIAFFDYTRRDFADPVHGYWAAFLRGEPIPVDAPEYIHEAGSMVDYVNLTQEERDMVDLAEKYDAIQAGRIRYAHDEGFEQGLEQGRAEERVASARRALAQGLPVEVVAGLSGLSPAEVEALR